MRSKASKDRGGADPAARGSAGSRTRRTGTAAEPEQAGPEQAGPEQAGPEQAGPEQAPPRARARCGPRNWRVRTRLLALIAIPTATAVIVSGIRIVSATRSAMAYQRVEALANLGEAITSLAQSLEDERDSTAAYIAEGKPATRKKLLSQQYSATDRAARQAAALAGGIGAEYSAQARARATGVLTRIDGLGNLRRAATEGHSPATVVIGKYAAAIDDLLAMDDEIAQGVGDPTLAGTVRVLGLLSRMKEEASQQRAILDVGLTLGRIAPLALSQLTAAAAEEQSNLTVFNSSATASQRERYLDAVSGSLTSRARSQEQSAISAASGDGSLAADHTTAGNWYRAMSDTVNRMRAVEENVAGSVAARARSLRHTAITWALAVIAAIFLVLLLALIVTALIARTIVGPLARLRAGALEVAGVRLPEMVRRLTETGGAEPPPDVKPIDVNTNDEIGEVARAFDQVHREALRLAANEAMLRANVNAMFVNLSERSQALVERQIQLIDELERDEENADRLANMFRIDHLATRMRRNSENLLVLAGHQTLRQWNSPVVLIDVLRAALAEIEHFERVALDIEPGIAVHGYAVNDVVHLVAELVENATSFSPADSPVRVSGKLLPGDGLLLDVTNGGAGMGTQEIAHANWRLDNPPAVDVEVSRRMGLFVVSRLAERHGIRVRLRSVPDGLTALVWLPGELVAKEAIEAPPGGGRFAGVAGHTSLQAVSARPKTVAEKVAAAVAAARTPRFGASLAKSRDSGFPAGEFDAAWSTAEQAVLSAPVREAAQDLAAGASAAVTGELSDLDKFGDLGAFDEFDEFSAIDELDAAAAPPHSPGAPGSHPGWSTDLAVAGAGEIGRLPIFDAVESDWFRHGRPPAGAHTGSDPRRLDVRDEAASEVSWRTSAADEGWRAAEAAKEPVADGTTPAGLPKRIPRANLVPGTAGADRPATRTPARSAEAVRERFGSYQRGVRAGHEAAYRRRRGPLVGGPPSGGLVGGSPSGGGRGGEGEDDV